MRRPAGRDRHQHRRRDGARSGGDRHRYRRGADQGARRGNRADRKRRLARQGDDARAGRDAVRRRPVQALHLPQIQRCAAGLRARLSGGAVRRRHRQFQLPALRCRYRVPAHLRRRQARRDARPPQVEPARAGAGRADLRRGQSGRYAATVHPEPDGDAPGPVAADGPAAVVGGARATDRRDGGRRRADAHRGGCAVRRGEQLQGAARPPPLAARCTVRRQACGCGTRLARARRCRSEAQEQHRRPMGRGRCRNAGVPRQLFPLLFPRGQQRRRFGPLPRCRHHRPRRAGARQARRRPPARIHRVVAAAGPQAGYRRAPGLSVARGTRTRLLAVEDARISDRRRSGGEGDAWVRCRPRRWPRP